MKRNHCLLPSRCRLGLYVGLASHGPCTAAGLASALGLNERYVAEWLRQQAAAHIITTDDAADKVTGRPVLLPGTLLLCRARPASSLTASPPAFACTPPVLADARPAGLWHHAHHPPTLTLLRPTS